MNRLNHLLTPPERSSLPAGRSWLRGGLLALLLGAAAVLGAADETIVVRVHEVRRVLDAYPLGLNLNYLRDDPSLRPPGSVPLEQALTQLGARWLRYPGGEKSDGHFFAPPPFERPDPVTLGSYARYRRDPLDFDEYMALVRRLGAIPYVVVSYDSPQRFGRTRAEYLAHAVGWVKYANVTRGYGVKYWEVGNENWHNGTATAAEMAGVALEFSRAMKAVDPAIAVGTNANSRGWANTLVEQAGDALDFISYSNYYSPAAGAGYAKYEGQVATDLIAKGRELADVVAKSRHRGRLPIIAAEFGAADFTKEVPPAQRWENNDLGHALVLFDMMGQFLNEPRITAAMAWTTRWMDDANPSRRSYSLGVHNEILPVGRPLELWRRFSRAQMVAAQGLPGTSAFASFDPASRQLTVAVVNRTRDHRLVSVAVADAGGIERAAAWHLAGTGPADRNPTWAEFAPGRVAGNAVHEVALASHSITILELGLAPGQRP